jgi:hypothetical protein
MTDDRSRDPFRTAAPDDLTPPHPVLGNPSSSAPFDRPGPITPVQAAPIQAPPVRSRGGGMLINVVLGIALVVAVGGVAFAAGRVSAPPNAAAGTGLRGQGGFVPGAGGPTASGAPGGAFGGAGGGAVALQGTVTAMTADSITLELASGQSVTIPTDASTTWHEQQAATSTDVTTGSTVIIQVQGGRGAGGQGGGQAGGPTASGAPGRALGSASTVTLVPAGS